VLEALSRRPNLVVPELADPLPTLRAISRDVSLRRRIELKGGETSSAIEVQRAYLAMVRAACDLSVDWKRALVEYWERILADLETDPELCADRLDWVAKRALIRQFQEAEGVGDDDPWLCSLDLEYHRLNQTEGLFYGLEQAGSMIGSPDEAAVLRAVKTAPSTTRAAVRGLCVHKFHDSVETAQWDHVTLKTSSGDLLKIDLTDLFREKAIRDVVHAIERAATVDDLAGLLA
jgi:hypothetical protein